MTLADDAAQLDDIANKYVHTLELMNAAIYGLEINRGDVMAVAGKNETAVHVGITSRTTDLVKEITDVQRKVKLTQAFIRSVATRIRSI